MPQSPRLDFSTAPLDGASDLRSDDTVRKYVPGSSYLVERLLSNRSRCPHPEPSANDFISADLDKLSGSDTSQSDKPRVSARPPAWRSDAPPCEVESSSLTSKPKRTTRHKTYYRGHLSVTQVPSHDQDGIKCYSPELHFHSSSDWISSDIRLSSISSSVGTREPSASHPATHSQRPSPVDKEGSSSTVRASGRRVCDTGAIGLQHDAHTAPPWYPRLLSTPEKVAGVTKADPPASAWVQRLYGSNRHYPAAKHSQDLGSLLRGGGKHENVDLHSSLSEATQSPASVLVRSPTEPWSPLSPTLEIPFPRQSSLSPEAVEIILSSGTPERPLQSPDCPTVSYPSCVNTPSKGNQTPRTTTSNDADDEKEILSPLSPDVEIHRGPRRQRHRTRFAARLEQADTNEAAASKKRCASYYDEDVLNQLGASPGKKSHRG